MARALDRHALERIARAVVSGRRGLGVRADRLADDAAGLTRNRLAALGAPGAVRAARLPVRRRALASAPASLRRLLERVAKHLTAVGRGGPGAAKHRP
jgi:hypothetical protein